MHMQEYNIHASFQGSNVEINLKDCGPHHNGENVVDFQGTKYSVTISGIPEGSINAKKLMFELQAAFNEPAEKTTSTLTDKLLSHKIQCTQINTNEGQLITQISQKVLNPLGSALFESAEEHAKQEIVAKLIQCNGSKDEIRKIFQNIPPEHMNAKFLMNVAISLAEQGETVKSFHLFSFLQNSSKIPLENHEKTKQLFQITETLLKYGNTNDSVKSFEAAYYFLCCLKYGGGVSPEDKLFQKIESHIHDITAQLEKLSNHLDHNVQKQAKDVWTCIKINESIPPLAALSQEDVARAREDSSEINEAFALAETYQNEIDRGDDPELAPPGRFIEIESKGGPIQIHVNITGQRENEKDPVIIIEAGNGCFSADYQQIQNQLEKTNPHMQVISYDRAGAGWSEKGSTPSTLDGAVSNLEQLLKNGEIKPPYIIVGHSYGGFIAQLYALRHPEDVKGIVLVDSATIEQKPPPPKPPPTQLFEHLPPAVIGGFFSNSRAYSFDEDTGYKINKIGTRTNHMAALNEELEDWKNGTAILKEELEISQSKSKRSEKPLTCPLKVISRGFQEFQGNQSSEQLKEEKNEYDTWKQYQELLANRSSEGELITAFESDHFIMWHEPEKITEQIQNVFSFQPLM